VKQYEFVFNNLKKSLVEMVSLTPLDMNKLSHYLNCSIGTILSCCMELEMEGKVIINHKMEIMKKKRIIIITEQQAKILVNILINESQIITKLSKQKYPPKAGILFLN
jgi:hypothetical protein